MSIEQWEPSSGSESNKNLDPSFILSFLIQLENKSAEEIKAYTKGLSEEKLLTFTSFIKADEVFWLESFTSLSEQELKSLIFFFSIAESCHTALEAGNESAVIALNKLLKQQKNKLSKEELLWIRSNSNNRFIPNGSVF